jgi:threonyl-tRNA synthetase
MRPYFFSFCERPCVLPAPGDFPLWLAPVQARVLPITDSQVEYAHKVAQQLKAQDIRVEVVSGERLPKMVRNANAEKIPLQLVVGKQEEEHGSVAVTARGPNGDRKLGEIEVGQLAERLKVAEAAKKRWFD